MFVAIEGCCHGELDNIYASISRTERTQGINVDLVIICGDFQAMRNPADLESFAAPPKYHEMGDFYKYYSGKKLAPYLTIVIGGNHEASNYLKELAYGGWLAPRIYYLGYAGVVNVDGLRIAGLSGIFKSHDYSMGHFEKVPLGYGERKSIYHIRQWDVWKLQQVKEAVDIGLSHDWPKGVEQLGNIQQLLRRKPFFQQDIETGELGSGPADAVLRQLKPRYWFSAHLHVKFAAVYRHGQVENPEEIEIDFDDLDDEIEDGNTEVAKDPMVGQSTTRFLALDKVKPSNDFLQILNILPQHTSPEHDRPSPILTYDREWLAITKALHADFPSGRNVKLPVDAESRVKEARVWLDSNIRDEQLEILEDFVKVAPAWGEEGDKEVRAYPNPQTAAFCQLIQVEDTLSKCLV